MQSICPKFVFVYCPGHGVGGNVFVTLSCVSHVARAQFYNIVRLENQNPVSTLKKISLCVTALQHAQSYIKHDCCKVAGPHTCFSWHNFLTEAYFCISKMPACCKWKCQDNQTVWWRLVTQASKLISRSVMRQKYQAFSSVKQRCACGSVHD